MRHVVSWISRFISRRRPSVVEQLEEIEEEALCLETSRNNSLHLEKRLVFRLFFYSVIFFGITFIAIYYFWPVNQSRHAVMLFYILGYPLAVAFVKWLLCGFFLRRIKKADGRLKYLKEQKQKLLEEVMETEVFNKAQQILKRFDPLSFASQTNRPPVSPLSRAPVSPSNMEIRQRKPNQAAGDIPAAPSTPVSRSPGAPTEPATPGIGTLAEQGPRLLRPILPRNRTVVDRIVDVLIGDGPDKRFALICRRCSGHNGMALKEEFEFIAFSCCYCSHHNPSRRSRQRAPVPPNIDTGHRGTVWRSSPNLTVTNQDTSGLLPDREADESTAARKRSSSLSSSGQPDQAEVGGQTSSSSTRSDNSTGKVTPQTNADSP